MIKHFDRVYNAKGSGYTDEELAAIRKKLLREAKIENILNDDEQDTESE